MALLYLLLVTLCQLYLILRRVVPPAEQKLPQILQNLYEQQNIILGFFIQLQDQEYSMTDLLLSPAATTVSETINGTTHTWQGLNLDQRPNWTQTNRWRCFSIYRSLSSTWNGIRNRHNSNHRKHKRHRYHNYLLAISLLGNPVFANTV